MCDLLGFDVKENDEWSLNITIGEEEWTIYAAPDLICDGGDVFGCSNIDSKVIYIKFTPETKIGEVALTVLHEICHAVLGKAPDDNYDLQHQHIYSVEYSYLVALGWLDVDFTYGNLSFASQLASKAIQYDEKGIYGVPIVEILTNWISRWKKW